MVHHRAGRSSTGLWRNPAFRKLAVSATFSAAGFNVARVAIPLIAVLSLRANEFQMGLLTAMTTGASLLVGLPAGVWVDRLRRRNVMIFCELARALIMLSIPLAWWFHLLTLGQLLATALLTGICTVFFDVASQSILPAMVGREHLVEGNSKLGGLQQVSNLAGPALSGQAVALLTAPVSLLVTSVALAASSVLVAAIDKTEEPPPRGNRNMWQEIGEGLRFVFGNRLMRAMAAGVSWTNLWGLAYSAMMIIYLARVLHLSPRLIGVALSISGLGGLIGALFARRLAARYGQGPTMWRAMLLGMPFLLVMPLITRASQIWLAAAGSAIATCGMVVANVVNVTARQVMTPDALLGRTNATMRVLNWSTMPVGAITGGALGTWLGPRGALVVAGCGACLGFLPIVASPLRTARLLQRVDADPAAGGPDAVGPSVGQARVQPCAAVDRGGRHRRR
jgi:MFS family permease